MLIWCNRAHNCWCRSLHIEAWTKWPSLQWRHIGRDGVPNQKPHDCLHNRLSRRRSKKHQSSSSLAFMRGIHRWPLNSPHKWPVTRTNFHLMTSSWSFCIAPNGYLNLRYVSKGLDVLCGHIEYLFPFRLSKDGWLRFTIRMEFNDNSPIEAFKWTVQLLVWISIFSYMDDDARVFWICNVLYFFKDSLTYLSTGCLFNFDIKLSRDIVLLMIL